MTRPKGSKNRKTLDSTVISNEQNFNNDDIKTKLNDLSDNFQTDKTLEDIEKEKKNEKAKEYNSRYRNKKQEEKEIASFTQSFGSLGSFLLDMLIARLPNPQQASEEEKQKFNELFTTVLFKYNFVFGNYQDEIALGTFTFFMILPRLKKPDTKNSEPASDD